MCEYCGCREVEPIAQLMDEHYALLEVSGAVRARLTAGDAAGAGAKLAELGRMLAPHARREERGLFRALREQGDFAGEVLGLEADHRAFDKTLFELDATAPDFEPRVRKLLADLSFHIERENLGVFPVSVVTLGAEGWDLIAEAQAEEPGFAGEQLVPRQ